MSWINVIFGAVILNSVLGTSAFLVLRIFAAAAIRSKAVRAVYPIYKAMQVFYIVPGIVLLVCVCAGSGISSDFLLKNAGIGVVLCLAFAAWAAGAFVTMFSYIRENRKMLWLKRNNLPLVDEQYTDILEKNFPQLKGRRIVLCSNFLLKSPCTTGIFRKEIMLPEADYTEEELRAVLLHEAMHIVKRDNLVKQIARILAVINWFNPVMPVYMSEISEWAETACDISVCRRFYPDNIKDYFWILCQVYAKSIHLVPEKIAPSPRSDSIYRRIQRIQGWNRK